MGLNEDTDKVLAHDDYRTLWGMAWLGFTSEPIIQRMAKDLDLPAVVVRDIITIQVLKERG